MTDLQVYLRAAGAVRTGNDLYRITDDSGMHYTYAPPFAILLVPLADPPPGIDRAGMFPFAVSVGIWYACSILCLAAAAHGWAQALERLSPTPLANVAGKERGWWRLRLLPVLACLPAIGHSLSRGQANLLLQALLACMASAAVRGRRFRAGLWLAGAICLKLIPAFLILYPLWRRDGRWLAGTAAGLVLGLAVLPAAVFGPARTVAYYQSWNQVVLQPGLGSGRDQSRAPELLNQASTNSQSLVSIIHKLTHWDRATRPLQPDRPARAAHWLLGGILTGITLWACGRRRKKGDGTPEFRRRPQAQSVIPVRM